MARQKVGERVFVHKKIMIVSRPITLSLSQLTDHNKDEFINSSYPLLSTPTTQNSRLQRFQIESSRLLYLGLPLIVAHLAIIGMAVTDTIMAGQASAVDLAGLAIGSGLWIAASVMVIGLISALSPIIAQLRGAKRLDEIPLQVQQGMFIAAVIGLLMTLILWLAPLLLNAMTLETEVRRVASGYLQILALAALPLAFASLFRNCSEAMGYTRPTMVINLGAFLANILLDYALVFGRWGLPEMGGVGCGIATTALNWVILLLFVVVVSRHKGLRPLRLLRLPRSINATAIRHQLHIGLPIAVGITGEVLFFGIMALLLAPLGAIVVGAHQVAQNFGALIYMIPLGLAQAIAIRVAHSVGSAAPQHARRAAWNGVAVGTLIAVVTALITIIWRSDIASIYSSDPQVQALTQKLLLFCGAYQLFDALQITAWGALRGYKDTRAAMVIQLTSYWLIGFPIGYSLALTEWWQPITGLPAMGAQGFWIGIICGLAAATVMLNGRLWKVSQP